MDTINNITIGSDPEFAAFLNGKPVSVIGFLPGDKKDPYPMEEGCSVQVDNVGAETCIPPCKTKEEFIYYMMKSKELAEKELNKKLPGATLESISSAIYDDDQLANKTAREFGCTPSFCCYTQDVSPRPSAEEVGNLRSFGFHIHIGFDIVDDLVYVADRLMMCMDIELGVASILMDDDEQRRNIYGNAGDFRVKRLPHVDIVEYRTLGAKMHCSEEYLSFCWDQTMKAIDRFNNWNDDFFSLAFEARDIIDNGFVKEAREYINKLNIQIPEIQQTVCIQCQ